MTSNRPRVLVVIGFAVLFAQIVIGNATGAEYLARKMRIPAGVTSHFIESMSESGRVGGYLRYPETDGQFSHPVVWDSFGEPLFLGFPQQFQLASVLGFRSDDTPVGIVRVAGGDVNAAVWEQTGFRTSPDLGFGGAVSGGNLSAMGGETYIVQPDGSYVGRATIWDSLGMRIVQGLGDLRFQRVYTINSSGTYVGVVLDSNFAGVFVGSDGTATLLHYPGFADTRSFDINDDGWISGIWSDDGLRRGFVARDQQIHDLGLFEGYIETWAGEINNSGTVVGAAADGIGFRRALVWDHFSGSPQDLNLLTNNLPAGIVLSYAYEINNAGQILALATDGFYVLTPIPEPAAVGIVALVWAGMCTGRRPRLCEVRGSVIPG